MKSILVLLSSAVALTSCQTGTKPNFFSMTPTLKESVLHCSVPLSSGEQNILTIEMKFPSSEDRVVSVRYKSSFEKSFQNLKSEISTDGSFSFDISDNQKLVASLDDNPKVAIVNQGVEPSKFIPCVQLASTGKNQNNQKQATCQAVGTPAEGWYQAGKIIQHSRSCGSEFLTCGSAPLPGWYVQKKLNKTKVKSEICAQQKIRPTCQSVESITGWYVDKSLVAKDESCASKSIECNGIGTQEEGWVTYERSAPQLLVSDTCQSSRNISYLAR